MGKQYRDQDYLNRIGSKLVDIRNSKGISQEKFSELTLIDARQIGRVERAETNASISLLKLFADKLGIKVSDLLEV